MKNLSGASPRWRRSPPPGAVSGTLYDAPGQSLLRLVVISLGNVAGGLFLRLGEKWKEHLDKA